jgi:hypothetical protein
MTSGDLIPSDHDQSEPASSEVQFALVIARMIDSVKNSPADMRQIVYDLARYKLREQFTYSDAKDIKRTEQALETAIRGVEEFSKQHASIPAPSPPPQFSEADIAPPPQVSEADIAPPAHRRLAPAELIPQIRSQPRLEVGPEPYVGDSKSTHPRWPHLGRTATIAALVVGILGAVQQRERLLLLTHNLPKLELKTEVEGRSAPTQVVNDPTPASPPVKPAPLRPTDYGVYAISNDALFELNLLPGRPLDIRVAVSAAFKMHSRTILPNGHPKFIVFRRDAASNIADRAEVRMVARIAREFSAEVIGQAPADGDDMWVIRNISFPFRSSPVNGSPEMYEVHSEDAALELSPGRYALILKTQAYDFTVEGVTVDPKQCIERTVASNGTFYSDCKKP